MVSPLWWLGLTFSFEHVLKLSDRCWFKSYFVLHDGNFISWPLQQEQTPSCCPTGFDKGREEDAIDVPLSNPPVGLSSIRKIECCCPRDGELCYLWPWIEMVVPKRCNRKRDGQPTKKRIRSLLTMRRKKLLFIYSLSVQTFVLKGSYILLWVNQINCINKVAISISSLLKLSGKKKSTHFTNPRQKFKAHSF